MNQRQLPWRQTSDPYKIWVSEVMLQQTQVVTVQDYYEKFLARFPDLHTLAHANLQAVLKTWEGLGYYARARNLHRAARIIVEEMQGVIPADYHSFRKLPGVGEYIAAAVQSIAFNKPVPVVDGNVKRVLARLYCLEAPVNHPASGKIFKNHAEKLLDTSQPGLFNQALMELGAIICRPQQPRCSECPLKKYCRTFENNQVLRYPIRIRRKPVPEYSIAVGVIYKNNHILITQRKPQGLLGGLWEFPGGNIQAGESAEAACIREIKEEVNLTVEIMQHLTRIKHAYTHFKIVADVFCCRFIGGTIVLNGPADYRWITIEEIDLFPFPGANHKFIPMLRKCDEKN